MRSFSRIPILSLLAGLSACADLPVDPITQRAVLHPVRAAAPKTFAQVSAGFTHTCALTADGTAWCWGANHELQLGIDTPLPQCQVFSCTPVAQQAGGTRKYKQIVAGTVSTCAIDLEGKTWCWGLLYRWLDTLELTATPKQIATDSTFISVTGGDAHFCGLTAGGTAMCWGVNTWGELGDSTKMNRRTPVVVVGGHRFKSLSASGVNTCGVTIDGDAYCWGDNRYGQIGAGEVPYNSYGFVRTWPRKVEGGHLFTTIAVGGNHVCALDTTGAAWCWGRNDNAQQLGDDSGISHRGVPVRVVGSLVFDAIAAAAVATCGHTPTNSVHCWGSDYFGGLGDGREVNGGVGHPVLAAGGPYKSVSPGGSHSCGLALDGTLWCWGDGLFGQLGNR